MNHSVSIKRILLALIVLLSLSWLSLFAYLRTPGIISAVTQTEGLNIEAQNLRKHVEYLASIHPSRSYTHPKSMRKAEEYIRRTLIQMGYEVELQEVSSTKNTYHNIVARYGPHTNNHHLVVLGAHYDVAGTNNPGADDNASGVAGLLELARTLKLQSPKLEKPIELVFYTLEEPPFFATEDMGSAYHVRGLKKQGKSVDLMISLEMLGYYSDEWFSQGYPVGLLYAIYPWKGNFIGVVGRSQDKAHVRLVKSSMAANSEVKVISIAAPESLPAIDFSDHLNYWKQGWPAVMITDTAFFRNKQYHKPGDTADRLDYKKMAEVVRGVYSAVLQVTTEWESPSAD